MKPGLPLMADGSAGESAANGTVTGQASPSSSSKGGSADNFLFTGAFLYSVPIGVPPGIAGMQPELTANYNSSAGNSWMGNGWDLSLGSIQRSTKNGIPKYDESDTYVLTLKGQAQELVKITDGTYRAKIEGAFMKFVLASNGWTVNDKSGMVYRFGADNGSRIIHPSSGKIYLWALNRVDDRNGNYILVAYTSPANTHQLYPDNILYTGNNREPRNPKCKVVFTLRDRQDVTTNNRTGFEMRNAHLISEINSYVSINGSWERASKVAFSFLWRTVSLRSLLQKVTVTGFNSSGSQTQDVARFEYPTESSGWVSRPDLSPTRPFSTGAHYWIPTQAQFIDLNGDSLPDLTDAKDGGPETHGIYMNNGESLQRIPSRYMPVEFAFSDYHIPTGTQFTDLNGDGLPDIAHAMFGVPSRCWVNTGSDFFPAQQFALPFPMVDSGGGANNGTRLIDLNGDERADYVVASKRNQTDVRKTWINTGAGWQEKPEWTLPEYLFNIIADTNAQFVDLNGDHRPDFVYAPSQVAARRTWINTPTGWQEDARWSLPEYFMVSTPDGNVFSNNAGVRFADVNGDGLPDLLAAWNTGSDYYRAWINNGHGWTEQAQWRLPNAFAVGNVNNSMNSVLADINGDGLVDFLVAYYTAAGNTIGTWLNTGNGWSAIRPEWALPQALGVQENHWPGSQVVDLNGDQLADFSIAYPQLLATWISNAAPHGDLLKTITNVSGGKITVDYEKSSVYANKFLPFSVWVVKSLTNEDGRGQSLRTNYSYSGGLFDLREKEFLGFSKVEVADPDGNRSVTTFFQNTDPSNNFAPNAAFKGRPKRVEQYHYAGPLLSRQDTIWEMVQPYTGVYFVRAKSNTSTLFEGSPQPQSQTDTYYDDTPGAGYGNVVRTVNQGDPNISGDELIETVEYAQNTGSYLMSFPKQATVLDANGTILSQTKYFYDGSEVLGDISNGNVTKVSRWLDSPAHWVDTRTTYNKLGQPIDIEDARHQHVLTTYDTYGFPISVTNPFGHMVRSLYDPRTGSVTSNTDPNNQVTSYIYDPLGRQTKVVGPLDSEAFPTTLTNYHDELLGNPSQQYIETRNRIKVGQSEALWSKTFFDGLGRNYRSEQSDVDSNSVISETLFNNRGLTWRTSVPRFSVPVTSPQWTENTYDPLGRVVQTRQPDGTSTTTQYQGRTTSVQDANGNVQFSEVDAYGRVIHRNEPGIPNPTTYTYDRLGRLTKLTDSQGNISLFAYDSLGRKISMRDPNAGSWSYSYDDNGNLLEQTDARGVTISFEYDSLGRLKKKTLTADPQGVTGQEVGQVLSQYSYDAAPKVRKRSLWPYEKGLMTMASDPASETCFYHDKLGRVIKETKSVDGMDYTTLTTYDALGRVSEISTPSDEVVKYVYDGAGRLSQVTNGDGSIIYASYPTYNALGQSLERQQNNGLIRTQYTYHPTRLSLSRLYTDSHPVGETAQTLQDLSYSFNPAGNITRVADAVHSDRSQVFTYDNLHRLTRAVGVYGDQPFTYDPLGNFLTKGGSKYLYEDPLHPSGVTQTSPREALAQDASTLIAWDLDSSEPIYQLRGTVTGDNSAAEANAQIKLSGMFNRTVLSGGDGGYFLRGLAGGVGANYALALYKTGKVATPLGQAFNPLTASQENLDFTLSSDPNPPLDLEKVRIPRTRQADGVPQGVLSGDHFTGGLIGPVPYGGLESSANQFTQASGYSPMSDPVDSGSVDQGDNDSSSGGDGAISAGPGPEFVTGRYRQALSFNGASDVFVIPNSQTLAPSQLTLMIWVKPISFPTTGFGTLLAKSPSGSVGESKDGFRLVVNSEQKVVFEIGSAGASMALTSAHALEADRWTFVTATYDGSQMKIYLNGLGDIDRANSQGLIGNLSAVTLGASLTADKKVAVATLFSGALDEPRLHSRAWTAAQVSAAYAQYQNIATFSYDANGNINEKIQSGVRTRYQFDAEGRLTSLQQIPITSGDIEVYSTDGMNGGSAITFVYDGGGGRLKKTTSKGTTLYLGKIFEIRADGSQVTHVASTGGDLICELVKPFTITRYAPITGESKGGITGGSLTTQAYYVHPDHLGSTSLVTDASGHQVEDTLYEPFGAIFTSNGTSPLTRKYTGQELDIESGLAFYNARYYDPTLGRFISADTIVPSAGDPQSFNRYAYVRNNPVMMTDPSGHSWLSSTIRKGNSWVNRHSIEMGIGLQVFTGFANGVPFLMQTERGQNILAGEIVAMTTVASFYFGGPIWWGALTGELAGGYSSNKSGRGYLTGVAIGGVQGAAMGGIMNGVDKAGLNPIAEVALKAHIGGMVSAANGGRYERGAMFMAAAATVNVAIKSWLSYRLTSSPGKGVPQSNEGIGAYEGNIPPSEGNTIGYNKPLTGDFWKDVGTQGGAVSRALNPVPTFNAFSKVHDLWMNGISGPIGGIANFPLMPPAMMVSDMALMGSELSFLTVNYSLKN